MPVSVSLSGEEFDIRDFHEEILRLGPVPIHVMELAVYQWIREQTGQAAHAVAISNSLVSATVGLLLGCAAHRLSA